MKMFDKTHGRGVYKTRATAVKKLKEIVGDTGPATLGMFVANSNGTFSPAVLLTDDSMHLALPLAHAGVYVMK